MSSDPTTCPWRDTAYLYVLGILAEAEDRAFREHLQDGCGSCGAECQEARRVVADLDLAVAQTERHHGAGGPPESLRSRVLDDLGPVHGKRETPFSALFNARSEPQLEAEASSMIPGVALALASEEGWSETGISGVEFKLLAEDGEREYATALVRMAAGASYPAHRHSGREECYVISGDLRFGEHHLTAGDFQVAQAGSVHPPQSTEEGCVLLVVSSQNDEPLGA